MRLDEDTAEWDEAEPADGLNADDEAEGDKEAAYALEALDRVCAAVEGRGVVPLLLPQVEALVGGGAWQQRHAALIALAQVGERCGPKAPAVRVSVTRTLGLGYPNHKVTRTLGLPEP